MPDTKVYVHLFDTHTGNRHVYTYRFPWYYTDIDGNRAEASFIWESGNYSCDCNRLTFMYGDRINRDWECGEGRVRIEKICLEDGVTEVYHEYEQEQEEPQEKPTALE